jgi:hypothetical protein
MTKRCMKRSAAKAVNRTCSQAAVPLMNAIILFHIASLKQWYATQRYATQSNAAIILTHTPIVPKRPFSMPRNFQHQGQAVILHAISKTDRTCLTHAMF